MSGLSSPPNGRGSNAGRKPIPRALRVNLGLPVCLNPECARAPTRRGLCRPHYEEAEHPGHASIGPVICTSVNLPEELHQRAHAASKGTRGGVSGLIREALAEKLARMG
jgi:hypothetical protein